MSELHAIDEIPERGAPAEIAAIYAELRQALDMPLVNLIYRHFATHPGFLPWAWSVLRPLAASGALQAAALRLRDRVREHVAPRALNKLGEEAMSRHGLDPAAARAIAELVSFYNRGNCMNVLAMRLLLRALDAPAQDEPTATRAVRSSRRAARESVDLPPIPPVDALGTSERALIAELNRYGEPGEPRALATLYRHVAGWPGCLALWRELLAPLEHAGALDAARRFTGDAATAIAETLDSPRGRDAAPRVSPGLRATIEGFASVTISKMIPIGLLLAQAFGAEARDGC